VKPHPAEEPSPESSRKKRVLLADDDPALVRSFTRVLGAAGYEVVGVGDGAAALEALDAPDGSDFGVILCDIHMPVLSGVEVLRAVRERGLDVPVVLVTADPRVETAISAVELGALQYLTKPVSNDALIASIERASKTPAAPRPHGPALNGHRDPVVDDARRLSASFDRVLQTLWVAFQPIVGNGATIFGYEALLRSDEPALPHPHAVLGAAERLGRLPELGRRIRQLVAESFSALPEGALLFINLHSRDLLDPLLLAPDMPLSKVAGRVVLEITERSTIDDIEDVHARVGALRAMGFRIALDDLGAGYAGLTSFAQLEPEFVKLDMSLVRNVHTSPIRQKVIASMATLCRDMGMQVVAEGIETVEERDAVLRLGCDLLQGYLLGRPGRPFPHVSWP